MGLNRNNLLWTFFAGTLGVLINCLPVRLSEDVVFVFGPVFSIASAILLGPVGGALAAALMAFHLLLTASIPCVSIVMFLEAISIGFQVRRGRVPIIAALRFWGMGGIPLLLLLKFCWPMSGAPGNWEFYVLIALNGVMNVVLAELLLQIPILNRRLSVRSSRRPLRVQLLAGFILAAVVPMMLMSVFDGYLYSKKRQTWAKDRLFEQARSISDGIDATLLKHLQAIEYLGLELGREKFLQKDTALFLQRWNASYPEFISLLMADEKGKVLALSAGPAAEGVLRIGETIEDRPFFRNVIAAGTSYISGVHQANEFGNDPIVSISGPVRDEQGRIVGIVTGSLNLNSLGQAQVSLRRLEGAEFIILDQDERVVYSSQAAYHIMQDLSQSSLHRDPSLSGSEEATIYKLAAPGSAERIPYLTVSATCAVWDWRVYVQQPLAIVRADSRYFIITIAAGFLLALGFSVLQAHLSAGNVTRSLRELHKIGKSLASQHRIEHAIVIDKKAPAEIAALLKDFDQIARHLSSSYEKLENAVREREELNWQMNAFVEDLDRQVAARTEELVAARDKAEKASQAKSEFLANISHEIRTPMNGVVGLTEVLASSDLSAQQRELAQDIQTSAENLLSIINDILDFSKIESGALDVEAAEFDLIELLRQTMKVFAPQARAEGLELRQEVSVDQLRVRADERRIRQILVNLVGNAFKFTESGSVTVRLTLENETEDSVTANLHVEDTGIGMTQDVMAQLFEPFRQADGSMTRQFGGTGLGLTISQRLASIMKGQIHVKSEVGGGSQFTVVLPLQKLPLGEGPNRLLIEQPAPHSAGEDLRNSEDLPSTQSAEFNRNARILVVDDVMINRKVILGMLSLHKMHADTATNGQEALEHIENHHYDIVLMDCQMPVMDGYEATREIRRREEGARHTVIVAITAHALTGDRNVCLEAGMDDYVSKPVTQEKLISVLKRWIPAQEARAAEASVATPSDQENEILDLAILNTLREIEAESQPGFLAELIGIFHADAPAQMEQLRAALQSRNAAGVEKIAHRLKGASANIGAKQMKQVCSRIEQSGREDRLEEGEDLYPHLEQQYQLAASALANYL